MIPLVVSCGTIKREHLHLFNLVKEIVQNLPDGITCHGVCQHIVKLFYNLTHIRGKFNGFDHSWLEIKDSNGIIIDPYPVAIASGPIILPVRIPCWRRSYDYAMHDLTTLMKEKAPIKMTKTHWLGTYGSFKAFEEFIDFYGMKVKLDEDDIALIELKD